MAFSRKMCLLVIGVFLSERRTYKGGKLKEKEEKKKGRRLEKLMGNISKFLRYFSKGDLSCEYVFYLREYFKWIN